MHASTIAHRGRSRVRNPTPVESERHPPREMDPGDRLAREVLGGQDHQVGGPAIRIVHIGDRVAVVLGPCALGGDEDGFPAAASRGSRWTCVVPRSRSCLISALAKARSGGFPSVVRYARVMSAAAAV